MAKTAAAKATIRDMNLLPATRIGWEHKQQYSDRLAQLSAEGYLDAEEYQARMDWLQNAKTEEETKLVFKDLPALRVTKVEITPRLPRPKPRQGWNGSIRQAAVGCAAELGAAFLCDTGANASFALFFVFLTLAVAWGVVLMYRICQRGR